MPHADLLNSQYVAWRYFLESAEGWTRPQVEAYQLSAIRRIVAYAYQNTAGYRALYDDAGVHPDDIRCAEDLRAFPIVTREMIRDNLKAFSVSRPGNTYTTTAGSTGVPFGFYRNPDAFSKELASKAWQYRRVGWREGERQISLRGAIIDTPDHTEFVAKFNELRFSVLHLTPENLCTYYHKSIEYQPQWLRCYPSAGYIFARWLKDSGRSFPQLKGVLCASESLYDFQKDLLGEVFGCRVFSHYGQWELTVLAGFCEHEDTYHVLPQYGYAELVDPTGQPVAEPGQAGEIIGTSFIMNATPFVRYKTEDGAVLAGWECPACGRPYQVWERMVGRLQELMIGETGRRVSVTSINFHDDTLDDVNQFQFHQVRKGQVVFRYVPREPALCDEKQARLLQRLQTKLGADIEVELRAVDHIPPGGRGKHHLLVQEGEGAG